MIKGLEKMPEIIRIKEARLGPGIIEYFLLIYIKTPVEILRYYVLLTPLVNGLYNVRIEEKRTYFKGAPLVTEERIKQKRAPSYIRRFIKNEKCKIESAFKELCQ